MRSYITQRQEMRSYIHRVQPFTQRQEMRSSLQVFSAHITLLCFTLLLCLKLDHIISYSWWIIFVPLFMFHKVVARGSFSLSLPPVPHDHYWEPFHASVATRLLIAFEVLLCFYLEIAFVRKFPNVSLKFVFFPLLAFEILILFDNFRMLKALLPGYDCYNAMCEALPHFWVAISMVFFVAATVFILQKLGGDIHSLGWWDLFIIFAIAECFAFLACITWSNPVIPILGSQILLLMRLEGIPVAARFIPLYAVFSPIFLAQGIGVISASNLVEKIVSLLRTEAGTWSYVRYAPRARDSLGFLHRCSRLLGWWSTDEGSQEEQARIFCNGSFGYNTFSGYPPEIVKRMPKKDLTEEIWRLQATLNEQTDITESSVQNYESLQNEKVLCRVCFEREINTVLLPCRHHILCSTCSEKCQKCPICRVSIEERLLVYDA